MQFSRPHYSCRQNSFPLQYQLIDAITVNGNLTAEVRVYSCSRLRAFATSPAAAPADGVQFCSSSRSMHVWSSV